MRYLPLWLCSIICLVLSGGCSRDSFSISSITLLPTVVATHSDSPNSSLSEGLAVVVLASPLAKGQQYQLSVTPPTAPYAWEVVVSPFEAADLWFMASPDLLLPPDFELESGVYEVEVFIPDGRRFFQNVEFNRSKPALSLAGAQVAALEPLEWYYQGDAWVLTGYASKEQHMWRYTFYDSSDTIIYIKESADAVLGDAILHDGKIKESTTSVIASRFDDALGVYFVVRTLFT